MGQFAFMVRSYHHRIRLIIIIDYRNNYWVVFEMIPIWNERYFLNLFGLKGVFALILGDENAADGTKDMQQMANPVAAASAAPPGQPQDMQKVLHTFIFVFCFNYLQTFTSFLCSIYCERSFFRKKNHWNWWHIVGTWQM